VASAAGRRQTVQLVRDAANGQPPALHLGPFRLPERANEPLGLACQMLVPDEPDEQQQLEQLEFTWYLNNSLNERRLLARQTAREAGVKLIDARQSDLLGLPWPVGGGVGGAGQQRERNAERATAGGAEPARPHKLDTGQQEPAARHAHRGVRVAVAHLNLSWDQVADAANVNANANANSNAAGPSTQIGRLFCLARNSIGNQRRACLYSIEAPHHQQRQQQLAERSRSSAGESHPSAQTPLGSAPVGPACARCCCWRGRGAGRRSERAFSASLARCKMSR
jgi:hypothetical protein